VLLPLFGATPTVWTTCLLFFQLLMVGGYASAHVFSTRLKGRYQSLFLGGAVLLIGAYLPVLYHTILTLNKTTIHLSENPTGTLLIVLAKTIGLPFFLLACLSPLLQKWFSNHYPKKTPYVLYAVSNFGSLLALFSYPFFVEPYLTLQQQTLGWVILFSLCLGLLLAFSVRIYKLNFPHVISLEKIADSVSKKMIGEWVFLSALGSIVLMSGTHMMTQNIAPIPFLWILPLGVYLLSYIVSFSLPKLGPRSIFLGLLAGLLILSGTIEYFGFEWPIHYIVIFHTSMIFIACILCHGELFRQKPPASRLTLFYLMISIGGAIGGIFVSLVAPFIFNGLWEYEMSLIVIFAWFSLQMWGRFQLKSPWQAPLVVGVFSCLILFPFIQTAWDEYPLVKAKVRNFYGVITVKESRVNFPRSHKVKLYHGDIKHGFQYLHPKEKSWKTTYYGDRSGIGIALNYHPSRENLNSPSRVGIIGVGTGTLSLYGRGPQDYFRYYEINPAIVEFSSTYFTFIQDSIDRGTQTDIVIGDARSQLFNEHKNKTPGNFDILAIDAFVGDSIPIHLLTQECFELFLSHLAPNGVLAFHISNLYVDLGPLIWRLADNFGYKAVSIKQKDARRGQSQNTWVIVTKNPDRYQITKRSKILDFSHIAVPTWTDQFSSLVPFLE